MLSRVLAPRRPRPPALTGLFALLLAGCGSVDRDPLDVTGGPPVATPGASCASAFACPDGQRCDDGVCRLDAACPAAIAPRLVYENDTEAMRTWYVATLEGRDQLELTHDNANQPGIKEDRYLDLSSGAVSVWSHAPGSGQLRPCLAGVCSDLYLGTPGRVFGVGLVRQGDRWETPTSYPVPGSHGVYATDWLLGAGTFVVHSAGELSAWTLATGQLATIVSFKEYSLARFLETAQGPRLLGQRRPPGSPKDAYAIAPIEVGATWSPLLEDDAPGEGLREVVRLGEQWFAIHEESKNAGLDGPFRVYRLGSGAPVEVGAVSDRAVMALTGRTLGAEGPRLGADHVGRVVSCVGGRCRLMRVDLDAPAVAEQASLDTGAPDAELVRHRWLACGAVDVLVGSYSAQGSTPTSPRRPVSLWYARLAP